MRWAVRLALVVLGVFFALGFRLPPHLVLQTGDSAYPVGPITSRAAFVQEVNVTGPMRVASLEVLLATWGKPANTTHDEIRIFDGSGGQVQAMKLPPGTVADNAYVRVDLPHPIAIDGQGRFFVSLSSSDGSKADSITAWATPASEAGRLYSLRGADLSQGSLVAMIDAARPLKGAICVRVFGQGPRRLQAETALRVGGLLVFLALAACVWWLWSRLGAFMDRLSVESVYLAMALAVGVVLVIIIPPFQVPDEPAHFLRTWALAQGNLFANGSYDVRVPESVSALPDRIGSTVIDWSTNRYSFTRSLSLLGDPISANKVTRFTQVANYPALAYAPQVAAAVLCRILGRSPLLSLYLGRLLNLLAAVAMTYCALRLLPWGKPLLFLVAILPMTLSQMASLSPDALLFGGAFLFTALMLNLSLRDKLGWPTAALVFIASASLLTMKPGYGLLVALVLLLRPRQFVRRRLYLLTVLGSFLVVLAISILLLVTTPDVRQMALHVLGAGSGVNPGQQIDLVLSDPGRFGGVIWATLSESTLSYVKMTVGTLGWLTMPVPETIFLVLIPALLLVFGQSEGERISPTNRAVMVLASLAVSLVVMATLYASWTPVAAPTIAGVQGRYFIPVIPAFLLGIKGITLRRQAMLVAFVAVVAIVIACITLRAVLLFYH